MMMTEITPKREVRASSEEGSALVGAILILLLLTAVATGGYWVSRGEMSASQGYSMSVRALYVAESGLARYFAMAPVAAEDTVIFASIEDPCADAIDYPTEEDQDECYASVDAEEDAYLEDYVLAAPPAALFALTGATVYITSEFIMNNGISSIYEVRAEARVENAPDPGGYTVRAVDTWATLSPPFQITSTFAATGGVEFGGTGNEDHHIESIVDDPDDASCGSGVLLSNVVTPEAQVVIPMPDPDCPDGKGCPYKWNLDMEDEPEGMAVDSFFNNNTEITDEMGIDWDLFLSDAYFSGVDSVIELDDSQDFMDYFAKDKDKDFQAAEIWPITRYDGDISTDERVKGYGLLIVDGDVEVTHDKIEWTGLMLVGGTVSTVNDGHLHVDGALVAGLGCNWGQVNSGACRSVLEGDHHALKYRPCEIQKAWNRLMKLRPLDDLYREASPGG